MASGQTAFIPPTWTKKNAGTFRFKIKKRHPSLIAALGIHSSE
jgi:hypothetical protein